MLGQNRWSIPSGARMEPGDTVRLQIINMARGNSGSSAQSPDANTVGTGRLAGFLRGRAYYKTVFAACRSARSTADVTVPVGCVAVVADGPAGIGVRKSG